MPLSALRRTFKFRVGESLKRFCWTWIELLWKLYKEVPLSIGVLNTVAYAIFWLLAILFNIHHIHSTIPYSFTFPVLSLLASPRAALNNFRLLEDPKLGSSRYSFTSCLRWSTDTWKHSLVLALILRLLHYWFDQCSSTAERFPYQLRIELASSLCEHRDEQVVSNLEKAFDLIALTVLPLCCFLSDKIFAG